MANQRSKNKKVISVPLSKELLERIEKEAARKGKNRVDLINEVLKAALGLILLAFLAFHVTRSPKRWNAEALAATGKAAVQKIQLALK